MSIKKMIIQTCICLCLIFGYAIASDSENENIKDRAEQITETMSEHYTLYDLWDSGKTAVSSIVKAPAVVTGYIINSHEIQNYGEPINKTENGQTVSVYSVAGGSVIETGENEELGKYIKIKHESAVSTYGKCKKIYVSEGEHVRKGQVVASFYKDKNGEFYYDLKEMVP